MGFDLMVVGRLWRRVLGLGNSRGCGEVGKSAKGAKGANSGGGGEGLLAGGEVCQVCQLWRCPGGMRSGGPGGGEEFGLFEDEVRGGLGG
jgi:hypothetical protein